MPGLPMPGLDLHCDTGCHSKTDPGLLFALPAFLVSIYTSLSIMKFCILNLGALRDQERPQLLYKIF